MKEAKCLGSVTSGYCTDGGGELTDASVEDGQRAVGQGHQHSALHVAAR